MAARDHKAELAFRQQFKAEIGRDPKAFEVNMGVYGEPSPTFSRPFGSIVASRVQHLRERATRAVWRLLVDVVKVALGILLAIYLTVLYVQR